MSKISIIVPVYNASAYLNECIDSILNQTYKDIEIVCINDGSTDNSLNILNDYASKYNNIKVIDLGSNHGVSYARNTALENITGDFVCFLDSDDFIVPTSCEKLINCFNEENVDLACGGHAKLNKLNERVSAWLPVLDSSDHCVEDILQFTKHRNVSQKMFKSSIIKEYNIRFDESLHYMEDALFLTTYIVHCKKVKSVKEPLYIVRINFNSLCRNVEFEERRLQEKTKAREKIALIIKEYKNKL